MRALPADEELRRDAMLTAGNLSPGFASPSDQNGGKLRAVLDVFWPAGAIEAQGFNPGKHPIKRFALKGREIAWSKCAPNATEKELGIWQKIQSPVR